MVLPTFLLAGERRSGTTALYHWISQHPHVYMFPKADMDYFVDDEAKVHRDKSDGFKDWRETHSVTEYAALFEGGKRHSARGQKDADLLYWQPAHARLAEYLPNTKFIVALRNPVERAWSHYWNEVAKGREQLSFEEAIRNEETRCHNSPYAANHLSYVQRGFYDVSLKSFLETLGRHRVLVLIFDHVMQNPVPALRRIYEFIGVNPDVGLEMAGRRFNRNYAQIKRNIMCGRLTAPIADLYLRLCEAVVRKSTTDRYMRRRLQMILEYPVARPANSFTMTSETRQYLCELYKPSIRRSEEMLGCELSSLWL